MAHSYIKLFLFVWLVKTVEIEFATLVGEAAYAAYDEPNSNTDGRRSVTAITGTSVGGKSHGRIGNLEVASTIVDVPLLAATFEPNGDQPAETVASKLQREVYAIGTGIADGAVDRVQKNPIQCLAALGASTAIGFSLAHLSRRFGIAGLALEVVSGAAAYSMVGNGVQICNETLPAVVDIWNSTDGVENNKVAMTRLGTATFDFALASGGGILGAAAGRYRIPQLDKPTLPLSELTVRLARPSDMHQIAQVGNVCMPKSRAWLRPNEPLLVMEYPRRGVVGYANPIVSEREFGGLAVLPEYRKYSAPLLEQAFETMRLSGGVWNTGARENTSYKLLKYLERRGFITIQSDTIMMDRFSLFVRQPMHDVSWTFTGKTNPKFGFLGRDQQSTIRPTLATLNKAGQVVAN